MGTPPAPGHPAQAFRGHRIGGRSLLPVLPYVTEPGLTVTVAPVFLALPDATKIVKPLIYKNFEKLARQMLSYWHNNNKNQATPITRTTVHASRPTKTRKQETQPTDCFGEETQAARRTGSDNKTALEAAGESADQGWIVATSASKAIRLLLVSRLGNPPAASRNKNNKPAEEQQERRHDFSIGGGPKSLPRFASAFRTSHGSPPLMLESARNQPGPLNGQSIPSHCPSC